MRWLSLHGRIKQCSSPTLSLAFSWLIQGPIWCSAALWPCLNSLVAIKMWESPGAKRHVRWEKRIVSRSKDSKGETEPWQRYKTLRKKAGRKKTAIWQCPALVCSHAATQTMPSAPAVLEWMLWLPCWGGERAHVSPCWTVSRRATSAVASFPYLAALPILSVFCNQTSSSLQLPVHVDAAERNEWSSGGFLVPQGSFQIPTACIKGWNAVWTHSNLRSWGWSHWVNCTDSYGATWLLGSCTPQAAIFKTAISCLYVKGTGCSAPLCMPWLCDAVLYF